MRKLIYQDEVISDIDAFLNAVSTTGSITGGWRQYWSDKDIYESIPYQNKIKNVGSSALMVGSLMHLTRQMS